MFGWLLRFYPKSRVFAPFLLAGRQYTPIPLYRARLGSSDGRPRYICHPERSEGPAFCFYSGAKQQALRCHENRIGQPELVILSAAKDLPFQSSTGLSFCYHDDAVASTITARTTIEGYLSGSSVVPLFLCGNAISTLRGFPAECVDFVMTSPPYWGQRQYAANGIGLEATYQEYISNLLAVFSELRRVLKATGSFWLNIGDAYLDKELLGLPWRVAIALAERQNWTLRNSVIWNKVKGGPDNSKDKLRNVHEEVFHFVKNPRNYFYDADAIRKTPGTSKIVNGSVVSATGVSGVRYKRQIELSTSLADTQKVAAFAALDEILMEVRQGKLCDFRMIIRGCQRTTHSDSEAVSGRARELQQRGFYLLKYHPNGAKPGDVWDILPEDTQKRDGHFAPYPEDLCRIPLLATCPELGIALDPFCGTGTTMVVAQKLNRKSIGIDTSEEYIRLGEGRCAPLL
jgi:DNA modification methylase